MPRKQRRSGRPDILSRNVEISSSEMTVRISAVHERGDEPQIETQPWLELRGTVTEPVRDVKDVVISMYPQDNPRIGTARPAAIGAIIQTRPELSAVISWPHTDFDRLWVLAVGGRLKHAHLSFTQPRYRKALVISASFSTEWQE